jgi:hypothetical protein
MRGVDRTVSATFRDRMIAEGSRDGTVPLIFSIRSRKVAETGPYLSSLADFTHRIFRSFTSAVITVVCAPDEVWSYHPKHIEQFTEI